MQPRPRSFQGGDGTTKHGRPSRRAQDTAFRAPLVPWLADLAPAPGEASRARVEATDFRIPLDGGLGAASARLEVDLGHALHAYSAGFRELFGGLADTASEGRVPPFEARVAGGRLRYEGLVLEVEGKPCAFRGSYDPDTGEIQLDAEVPVSLLGRRMGMVGEGMGDEPMPLQVSGRWDAPEPAVPVRLDRVIDVLREGPGFLQDRAQSTWTRLIEMFSGGSG